MLDEYARQLIDKIPVLQGLDRDECRRALSRAFFYVVQARLAAGDSTFEADGLAKTGNLLRRLADSLESVAVFDPLNGIEVDSRVRSATAFVAAEALALLSELPRPVPVQPQIEEQPDPFQLQNNYTALEAGLLYMIGGYDINAATAVRSILISSETSEGRDFATALRVNGAYLVERILRLCQGNLESRPSAPFTGSDTTPRIYRDLRAEIRIRCYEALGQAVDRYLVWLAGDQADLNSIIAEIRRILHATASADYPGFTAFADIHHASALLLATLESTSRRSTVHSVPPPDISDEASFAEFQNYLLKRARGKEGRPGRPFLWPSATGYIGACLPGPSKDAVIAMPTGSGKSFVAEIGISHALAKGNVIYLAPTNALVHQIRRDLQVSLEPFEQTSVLAFVGNEEYTTLSEEQIRPTGERFVAVMTPEKCALALKLHPHAFDSCALCVFDECHLINDPHRGATVCGDN